MSDGEDQRDPGLATVTRVAGPGKPRASAVPARLRAVWPTDLSWTFPIPGGRTVVGRIASEACKAPLGHETVSRRHLAIEWDSRRRTHVASDLGSHNGSRVGGAELGSAAAPLRDGAILQLGDVCVVYERGDGLTEESRRTGAAVDHESVPGSAPTVLKLRAGVARSAPDPSPVLLLGETGTGKEWIAREVHRLSGRPGPLIAINCSALSPQIIDSQLFGHVKGAFTGATTDQPGVFRAADSGTLFLDEIGDLPLELQPKLLRALQEGEVQPVGSTRPTTVDVRVVAATNHSLTQRVEAGEFRRDLYARLALWELHVPPLRQRRGDLLSWIDRLYGVWQSRRPHVATIPLVLSPEAAEAVLLYDWPNNLRELDRLVHELGASEATGPIALADLPRWVTSAGGTFTPTPSTTGASALKAAATPPPATRKPPIPTAEEFRAVFDELDGNVRAMAKHFERDRRQIYRWIESYGLAYRRPKSDD